MHLLIDADSALYRAGCANEQRSYHCIFEGQLLGQFKYKRDAKVFAEQNECEIAKHKDVGPLHHTISNLNKCVDSMFALGHDSYSMYIGGKGNFRYEYFPEYKSNRDPEDKPAHLEQMKQHLIAQYGAISIDGEEVDDVVSYEQERAEKDTTCIVTIDKDLNNTAGYHHNWLRGETYYVTEQQADLNFARQLLSGDATDGIPGLRGVAVKTAIKLLPEWREDWLDFVKHTYLNRGYTLDYLNQMGICLWMRRKPGEIWSCLREKTTYE